jgi:DNA-binding transcriptional regulator GbsR (MarR family)
VAKKSVPNQSETRQLRRLSAAVGDFMMYWGFRRIHGQIWTQIYLSREPLSLTDLTKLLGVSKALVSPALSELVDHGLIVLAGGDEKTRKFAAEPDVMAVIRRVLEKREKALIQRASVEFQKLVGNLKESGSDRLDPERIKEIGTMIDSGSQALDFIIAVTDGGVDSWDALLKGTIDDM